MKTNILKAIIASVVAVGCSDDFLEVDPTSQEFASTYFTTDEHIQEAVIAAYDPLHWTDWGMGQYNPINLMSDIMADQIWVGGANVTDNAAWHLMMNYEALPTNCISGIWTEAYSGIKRCNDVLSYVDAAEENLSEDAAKYYRAQARVLRVNYYNWLWKFWGNVPYYEQNLNAEPYIAEQLSANEVYNNMVADLEAAIAIDALPMKAATSDYGRVTKAMAYMLYAEIVMYQNDASRKAKALQYMEEIIESGEYELVDDYASIFPESGEWSSESIWEINYKDDAAVRSWSSPLTAGGTVIPRLISPSNFKGTGYDGGWGFCPVRQETYDMYAANDARRDATCFNAKDAGTYDARYQDTGFFLEKYVAHSGDNADQKADADLNYNNNLRIYRYAETLLNAAELGSSNAKKYLNMVHNRAGLTDEVEPTAENILKERALEFVGEGKRYWDLIRTGNAATVLVPDAYGYRTNAWKESKKYLPIPQSEIDAAQNTLTQNNY
ncbi:MAG: RagB/SusD family nutrient uptake outer membrane protein [Bacteroidales bacterium]|nr:RagB/SusD family nutrient uptake outer membrane protein [Bacteroidales bacterium]